VKFTGQSEGEMEGGYERGVCAFVRSGLTDQERITKFLQTMTGKNVAADCRPFCE